MSCIICATFSKDQLRDLEARFRSGSSTEELAVRFQYDPNQIIEHCTQCLSISTREKLELALCDAFKQLQKAKANHDSDACKDTAYSYSTLLRETRELARALENMRSDKDLLKEVFERGLFPYTREICSQFISELRLIRDEMYTTLPDQSKHYLVDKAVERAVLRFGRSAKDQQNALMQIIAGLLGVTGTEPLENLSEGERQLLQ